jgi:uncharacterized protein (TIGR03083 family)
MALTLPGQMDAIAAHASAAAGAADGQLDAPVEHCPGWTVASVLEHLINVHWFWTTIALRNLPERPEESERPALPERSALIETFFAGAERMVRVLSESDQATTVWTWSPVQRDIAFISRHQVQEMVVHHFDVAHAAGHRFTVDRDVAADSVAEFLKFSLPNDQDPTDPPGANLAGSFGLRCADSGDAWTISDGDGPGTTKVLSGPPSVPTIEAPAEDVLLWLYGRTDLDGGAVDHELLRRFKALCTTD